MTHRQALPVNLGKYQAKMPDSLRIVLTAGISIDDINIIIYYLQALLERQADGNNQGLTFLESNYVYRIKELRNLVVLIESKWSAWGSNT